MDLKLEELEDLTELDVLREAVKIPRSSPRTFVLIAASLVFPLSFAVLGHNLLTRPIFLRLELSSPASDWILFLIYHFAYILLLFTFSLLSTAAVASAVASIYDAAAAKPVSFSSIFPRLSRTFAWFALVLLIYNLALALVVVALALVAGGPPNYSPALFVGLFIAVLAFYVIFVYISTVWHLATVVSVMEPLCGLAAMRRSLDLLRGRAADTAVSFVFMYLGACSMVGSAFGMMVVKGPDEEWSLGIGIVPRFLIGAALVAVLVVVNLVGLLFQSVFYYVCKSYHRHQITDKRCIKMMENL